MFRLNSLAVRSLVIRVRVFAVAAALGVAACGGNVSEKVTAATAAVVRSAASGGSKRLTSYRWHSVSDSLGGEISTVDGIADLQRKTFWMHIHSSIGTASGGNREIVNSCGLVSCSVTRRPRCGSR